MKRYISYFFIFIFFSPVFVILLTDGFFGGKFDPAKLETALNSYASEGWQLNATATADIPGLMGGARNEIIFILERKK